MANIFSYIKKYKNVLSSEMPFGLLDALVVNGISYLPLPFAPSNECLPHDKVEYILQKFIDHPHAYKECIMPLTDLKFARVLVKTPRFKDIIMYGYYEVIDPIEQKQFRAVSFVDTTNKNVFITYCGTDTTLVGWKEDFNLSYKKVPSQKLAVKYLRDVANKFPDYRIALSGHSKGGNLAMYAATYAPKTVQNRIIKVFNFDGPGLQEDELSSEGYQKIRDRIITFMPQYSMVGILFGLSDDYRIIKSSGPGVYNHSHYYWQIKDKDFVYSHKISKFSVKTGMVIQDAYENFTPLEKEHVVNNIYKLLIAGGAKTTHAITRDINHAIRGATDEFSRMSDDEQAKMIELFSSIIENYIRKMTPREKQARKVIEENCYKKYIK